MLNLGFFNTATSRTHVRFQFSTHAAAGGNVAPNSAFEAADIRIYRANDGAAFSATQRSSANGITMTSPFDSLTGFHDVDIDLTDNTDAGFYASGYTYSVVLAPDETVDSQTITGIVLAMFEIAVPAVNVTQFGGTAGTFASGIPAVNTTQVSGDSGAADNIETAYDDTAGAVPWSGIIDQGTAQSATGTTLVLRAAAAFADDEIIGATIVITGGSAGVGQSRLITDYVSATDTATVEAWTTTPTGTITYKIFATAPGTSGGGLDAAGVRAAIGMASANLDTQLSGLDGKLDTIDNFLDTEIAAIQADTDDIQTRLPAALVSGRMDASVGAMAANVMTAAAAAADLTTELQSGLATAAALDAVDNFLDTEIAAIKAVTDLLPDGGALTSLATQASVNTIDDFLDTEIAAIKAKTDQLTFTVANQVDSNAITIDEDEILDDALTDSVPADGALPTVRQALYMLTQFMFERSVSGTTVTVNKVDGTTALMTFTLNDGTSPTAITRAT